MRVHLEPPDTPSHALARVYAALQRYAPASVQFTVSAEADVVLLAVVGRNNAIRRKVQAYVHAGRRVVLLQCCLRSTMAPNTRDWVDVWSQAHVVWSYYDLAAMLLGDLVAWRFADGQFYHSPLGSEPTVFTMPAQEDRPYLVCTSGRAWTTESTRECALAAQALHRDVLHLGQPFRSRPWVRSLRNVSDAELAMGYGQCEFVSGLRRTEGFELPCVEGLLCGARPLVFDQPHYRWFDGLAVFLDEGDRRRVLALLTSLMAKPNPVTAAERAETVRRFAWPPIVRGLFEHMAR